MEVALWSYPQRAYEPAFPVRVVAGLPREPWGRQWPQAVKDDLRVRVNLVSGDRSRDFLFDSIAEPASYR